VQFGSRHPVEGFRQTFWCQLETIAGGTIRNHLGNHTATRNGNAASVFLEPGLANYVASDPKLKRDVGAASLSARDSDSIRSFHSPGVPR
jgi:hypothetical protein